METEFLVRDLIPNDFDLPSITVFFINAIVTSVKERII